MEVAEMRLPETVQSSDGVTLQLYDLGGSGPPLLMCHATGFCGQIWQPMADTIRKRFQCISFDFRAHGRSTPPVGGDMVWDGMADDVLAIVDAISPATPIPAVGHSMGGAALVLAAARRQDALAGIWAFEPILFDRGPAGEPTPERSDISTGARNRRAVFANRDEVFERYGSRPPLSVLDDRALRAYVDHGFADLADGSVTLRCLPEHEASVFDHHNSGALAKSARCEFLLRWRQAAMAASRRRRSSPQRR